MYMHVMAAAVPSDKRDEYLHHAQAAQVVMRDHGALDFAECWGTDVPEGEVTSFPLAVRCGPDETVAVSFVRWPSRQAADDGMQAFTDDPRTADLPMPFDGQRLIYGGFEVLANA